MRVPFLKTDPVTIAEEEIERLNRQRAKLAHRLEGAVADVESAVRARHDALIGGDIADKDLARLNQVSAAAAENRAAIEAALRTIVDQIEQATRRRDEMQEAAERQRVAEDGERRAKALDAAAEGLANAARAFGEARAVLTAAIREHGIRIDNPMASNGVPADMLARPAILAAVRAAAPGILPAIDGFGAALDSDCALVIRRGPSSTLRDFVEDVLNGRVPAVEMPRPGQAPSPASPDNPFAVRVELVRGVFREPFACLATGGTMINGEPGDNEVPAGVLRVAVEMEIAAEGGTPQAEQILRAVKANFGRPGYIKGRPGAPGNRRHFIDTDSGVIESAPPRTAAWPEADRPSRRA